MTWSLSNGIPSQLSISSLGKMLKDFQFKRLHYWWVTDVYAWSKNTHLEVYFTFQGCCSKCPDPEFGFSSVTLFSQKLWFRMRSLYGYVGINLVRFSSLSMVIQSNKETLFLDVLSYQAGKKHVEKLFFNYTCYLWNLSGTCFWYKNHQAISYNAVVDQHFWNTLPQKGCR